MNFIHQKIEVEKTFIFGVREHAMAAICNGISLHGGLLPYCATFFVFSDYLKPAVRLSALYESRCYLCFNSR